MESFRYVRAQDGAHAITFARHAKTAQQGADIRYIAGGTTLVDLMKLDVERPQTLIDVTHLPLTEVKAAPGGGVEIGAMARNSDLAHHPLIQRDYPVLSEALLSSASAQLRNKATTGGNLLQRNPLHVLPGRRHGLQQARAGLGLRRDHRHQSHDGYPRRQRALHRDQPLGHERRPCSA
jgi:CO/xanthine dehydrogenase FAD-binding subunit